MGTAPFLASGLFVLSAFFITAAVAASAGVEITAVLSLLLAACGAIILWVTSRRVLTAAFASALLHALISLSIVCHMNPPDLFVA